MTVDMYRCVGGWGVEECCCFGVLHVVLDAVYVCVMCVCHISTNMKHTHAHTMVNTTTHTHAHTIHTHNTPQVTLGGCSLRTSLPEAKGPILSSPVVNNNENIDIDQRIDQHVDQQSEEFASHDAMVCVVVCVNMTVNIDTICTPKHTNTLQHTPKHMPISSLISHSPLSFHRILQPAPWPSMQHVPPP